MSPLPARLAPALLLVLLAASTLGAATAHAVESASIGAIVGASRHDISGDAPPDAEYTSRFDLLGGAQGEIGIGTNVFLSLQPMYVRRGSGLTVVDDTEAKNEYDFTLALDYVAVPVVVKFLTGSGRTYVTGGVDVAFLTSAKLSGYGLEADVKDSFAGTDVGALLGFGVVFPLGRPRLTTELRYVLGVTNLGAGGTSEASANLPDRFHSSGLQLTAGILFPLGSP